MSLGSFLDIFWTLFGRVLDVYWMFFWISLRLFDGHNKYQEFALLRVITEKVSKKYTHKSNIHFSQTRYKAFFHFPSINPLFLKFPLWPPRCLHLVPRGLPMWSPKSRGALRPRPQFNLPSQGCTSLHASFQPHVSNYLKNSLYVY